MKGIIGRKLGMAQVYDETGELVPVTVIEAGPCPVIAVRTQARHGYSALQLGFGQRRARNVAKSVIGQLAAANQKETPPQRIREVRLDADTDLAVGAELKADVFAKGEYVDIVGQTKGRGFQGVVKRWRFAGGRASHGGGWIRRPGSVGMKVHPGRLYPGRKLPGHMGDVRRTVQNLRVVDVRPEENLLFVRGAVPGAPGGLLIVRSACKKS